MKKTSGIFILFFLVLLNFAASPQKAEDSSSAPVASVFVETARQKGKPPEPAPPHPQTPTRGLAEMEFPLVRPRIVSDEVKVWRLPDGSKVFFNMKEQKATVVQPDGDRRGYNRVQEAPADNLQLIAKKARQKLFGNLVEINYIDGSSDNYISPTLMATLDSSRRLVDLTLFAEDRERFVESIKSSRQSLTAGLNLALRRDPDSIRAARKIIEAAEAADLSDLSPDLRAQIVETVRRDLALLDSVSTSLESSPLHSKKN